MIISSSIVPLAGDWTPNLLPNFHSTFIAKLSKDNNKLYQNLGKTILAQNNNDPVCVSTCPFSNFDYIALDSTSLPLLKTDGLGKWWLETDGLNKLFQGPILSNAPYSIVFKYKKNIANDGRSLGSGNANWLFGAWQLADTEFYDGNFHSTNRHDGAAGEYIASLVRGSNGKIFFNGIDLTGTIINGYHPNQLLFFGTHDGEYFNGRISGAIITLSELSDADRIKAENYLASY